MEDQPPEKRIRLEEENEEPSSTSEDNVSSSLQATISEAIEIPAATTNEEPTPISSTEQTSLEKKSEIISEAFVSSSLDVTTNIPCSSSVSDATNVDLSAVKSEDITQNICTEVSTAPSDACTDNIPAEEEIATDSISAVTLEADEHSNKMNVKATDNPTSEKMSSDNTDTVVSSASVSENVSDAGSKSEEGTTCSDQVTEGQRKVESNVEAENMSKEESEIIKSENQDAMPDEASSRDGKESTCLISQQSNDENLTSKIASNADLKADEKISTSDNFNDVVVKIAPGTESMKVTVPEALPDKVSEEVSSMEVDDPIINSENTSMDYPPSESKKADVDQSIFIDEESCDVSAVLRKPVPVIDIKEETLAGDPRLESQDNTSSYSSVSAVPKISANIINASKDGGGDDDDDENTEDKSKAEKDDEEENVEEEEEEPVVKKPKKKKRPRRSIFYKPRPDKKKREKERAEAAAAAAAEGKTDTASPVTNIDEDSQGSTSNKEKKEVRRFRCEVVVPESTEAFTADKVIEYSWPLDGGYAEHYFIQEHISQYIGISSFKRKYPDLRRRPIDMAERDYLKECGLVSEIACDMGLMAVRSEDVMDVLFTDFPTKYEELSKTLTERRDNQLKERGKVDYQVADIDKSKLHEYGRRAAEEAARYNAALNREKREERMSAFDLQTFTLHKPIGKGKKLPPELTKIGHYPIAVLPGQYTDRYKTYTSDELFKLPLISVSVGPIFGDTPADDPEQPKIEPATIEKAEKEATPKTEAAVSEQKVLKCKVCFRGKDNNRNGKPEGLIVCAKCSSASHASCVDLNPSMIPTINSYNWQCMECKNCMACNNSDDEDKMIFCDLCDRGFHIYCVGLRRVPTGRWHCKECAICNSCGSKSPSGGEHVKNAEWQHEFKKNKDNRKICYATTLCVPCDKLWKKRQFCYVCLKVYKSIPEDNMVRCANCPKYVHKDSEECSATFEGEQLCMPCFKSSNTTILNHNRIIAAAKKKMASGF